MVRGEIVGSQVAMGCRQFGTYEIYLRKPKLFEDIYVVSTSVSNYLGVLSTAEKRGVAFVFWCQSGFNGHVARHERKATHPLLLS